MVKKELREVRMQMFAQMEHRLHESWSSEEDSLFYFHPSEDRIVLSHAMFWTMSQLQFFKSKLRKEKFFLLLRQYQEEIELLDDMDFDRYGKVKCRAIEQLMPQLMKMVDGETYHRARPQ